MPNGMASSTVFPETRVNNHVTYSVVEIITCVYWGKRVGKQRIVSYGDIVGHYQVFSISSIMQN